VDGIGRHVHRLARAVAAQGHQVHVLTRGESHDRVDFEHGVWVHRLVVRDLPELAPDPARTIGGPIPAEIWRYSMTMLAEAEEVAKRRPILAVHAPLQNAAAIAFLRTRKWPLVTSLHGAPCRERDEEQTEAASPLAAERELLIGSDGLVAPREAAIAAVEAAYGLTLDRNRLALVPDDMAAQEAEFLLHFAARRAFSPAAEPAETAA
jgi:glycogen(starch) synthase